MLRFAIEHFFHLLRQVLSLDKLGIFVPDRYHIYALKPLKNDSQVFVEEIMDYDAPQHPDLLL